MLLKCCTQYFSKFGPKDPHLVGAAGAAGHRSENWDCLEQGTTYSALCWHVNSGGRVRIGFLGGAHRKEPTCQCRICKRCGFDPWVGQIPWRKGWQPTPVFLPGESHGWRILAGYSPWGRKESASLSDVWLGKVM